MGTRTKKSLTPLEKEAIREIDPVCHYCGVYVDSHCLKVDSLVGKGLKNKPKKLQKELRRLGLPANYDIFDYANLHACHFYCYRSKRDCQLGDVFTLYWCKRAKKNARHVRKKIKQLQAELPIYGAKLIPQETLKPSLLSRLKEQIILTVIRAIVSWVIKLVFLDIGGDWVYGFITAQSASSHQR